MIGVSTVSQVLMVVALVPLDDGSPQRLDAWERFRSLAAPPPAMQTAELKQELFAYIKSLTSEDLFIVARQGCAAGENNPRLRLDWERKAAAESNALLCLEIYFEMFFQGDKWRQECGELAGKLAKRVADREECSCLRRAILKRISYSDSTRFQVAMMDYAAVHVSEVDRLLATIIKDQGEETELRKEAISAIKRAIHKQVRTICHSDSNVRKAIEENRRHTDAPVNVSELVRSGEAAFTQQTMDALEPVAERMRTNVKLLSEIVAQRDRSEKLRDEARRALESYRRLAVTQLDQEIDKALQQGGE